MKLDVFWNPGGVRRSQLVEFRDIARGARIVEVQKVHEKIQPSGLSPSGPRWQPLNRIWIRPRKIGRVVPAAFSENDRWLCPGNRHAANQ